MTAFSQPARREYTARPARAILAAAALAASFLTACTAAPDVSDPAPLALGERAEPAPGGDPVIGPDIIRPAPDQIGLSKNFVLLTRSGSPDRQTLAREISPPADDGSWTVRSARGDTLETVVTIRRQPDGSVAADTIKSPQRNQLWLFTPALLLLPAQLDPGSRAEQTLTMQLGQGGDTGPATQVIEHQGSQVVVLAGGQTIDTARVRSLLTATIGRVKVTRDITQWIHPDMGIIAERENTRVTVLGIRVESSERRLVLDDAALSGSPRAAPEPRAE